MTRIVVAGALANKCDQGGEAWVRLNWVLGLQRLGVDVSWVEQIDAPTPAAVAYFREVTGAFDLETSSTLLERDGEILCGGALGELVADAEAADALINISGNLVDPRLFDRFSRRLYVDLDPGFTQFWYAQGIDAGRLAEHDRWLSVGFNVGRAGCDIPTTGLAWRPLLPPTVLEEWPALSAGRHDRFTTVASWRGAYGTVDHDGQRYGLKVHEFRKLAGLPTRVPDASLEVALAIDPADTGDRDMLVAGGWHLVDPAQAVRDPERYREYVQRSSAELSPAQGIYVDTRSGWFSDRTAAYLASGRPAIVQDTGQDAVPAGEGLLTFRTPDDAERCVREVLSDWDRHSAAARALAEEHFDSDRVLGRVLEDVLT